MPLAAEEAGGNEAERAVTNDVVHGNESAEVDPFAAEAGLGAFYGSKEISVQRGKEVRETMRLRIETWELPSLEMVRALDAGHTPEAIEAWRKSLMEGAVLVFAPVLTLDRGYDPVGESITEQIYPTEYEGGGLNTPVPAKKKPASPVEQLVDLAGKFTVPTAFETRNTGTTVEATLLPVTAEDRAWDLRYSVENVNLDGFTEFGDPKLQVEMPIFRTSRINGLIRLTEGDWQLASAQPAPLGVENQATGKSWVTLFRIDRAR